MNFCVVPSCYNTKKRTPEKTFFPLPSVKRMRKRWCRRIKIECDFSLSKKLFVCEDHFDFEEDLENYMKVRLMNTMPVLKKNALPSRLLDHEQEPEEQVQRSLRRSQTCLKEEPTEEVSATDTEVPVKGARSNCTDSPIDGCSEKQIVPLGASHNCVFCQRVFTSQRSLAAHSSDCILHLGFIHTEDTCAKTDPEKLSSPSYLPTRFHYCNICFAKFAVKHTMEAHRATCEHDQKQFPVSSVAKEKDPLTKDVLHEKVIEDKSWLVTSLPEGYECVDAMFVVEAEGICMLQQEIPVMLEESSQSPEEQPEEEEEEDDGLCSAEERLSPSDQNFLPPWCITLLPGALETEEEKEMMEQKLVLEPRLMARAFGGMRGPFVVEQGQNTLVLTEIAKVKEEPKEVLNEDSVSLVDFVSVKIEPKEVCVEVEKTDNEEKLEKEKEEEEEEVLEQKLMPGSPTQMRGRTADAQVACH